MIKSMTGFGRGEYSDDKKNITVEIKSVNHRYCDIYVKAPRKYSFAEEKIKAAVKEKLTRGKIEVSINTDNFGAAETDIKLNKDLAARYYENLTVLKEEFNINEDVSLELISSMPDVIRAVPNTEDEEEILRQLLIPVRKAAENMCEMRAVEGVKLAEDILMRATIIEGFVEKIKERAPNVSVDYAEKLKQRIEELMGVNAEFPEDRIMLEAAIFADKANITEEIIRLESHISQLRNMVNSDKESIGRKIDFLVQEMNREANTIGSKSNDIEITNLMLDTKAEIEKIREQVQNIE